MQAKLKEMLSNKLDREQPLYQAVLLGGACALVSVLLLLGNSSTQQAIAAHLLNDKLTMLAQVLPVTLYNNQPLNETVSISDSVTLAPVTLMQAKQQGQLSGMAIQLTVAGWGGPLQMIMAVNPEGELLGVRVISHKETPGLADKIEREKSPWIEGFKGKSLANTRTAQWAVKKDGGEFDQFTGATITPRAVVRGVHHGLLAYQKFVEQQFVDQQQAQQNATQSGAQP